MTQFLGPMTDKQKKKIQACRKAVEQHPQDAEAHFELGLACRKGKCWKEAAQAYEISIRLNPKNKKAMHGLAISYRKLKRYVDSIAICQGILQLDPDYAKVYFNLGLVYEEQGEWDKAIEQHRKALDLTRMIFKCITTWHEGTTR